MLDLLLKVILIAVLSSVLIWTVLCFVWMTKATIQGTIPPWFVSLTDFLVLLFGLYQIARFALGK